MIFDVEMKDGVQKDLNGGPSNVAALSKVFTDEPPVLLPNRRDKRNGWKNKKEEVNVPRRISRLVCVGG